MEVRSQENSLREFAVGSISREYNEYVARIPVFQDFARNSRDRFGERRLFTPKTVNSDCGSSALVLVSENTGKAKVISMERCHNRFCPLCSYVEMKKDSRRVKHIFSRVAETKGHMLIGFTFAFPNCTGEQLNDDIKHLNYTFKRFIQQTRDEGYYAGSFRKLEVTYNNDLDDPAYGTYNPHLHVLLHVKKDKYFGTQYYRDTVAWTDLFKYISGRYDVVNFKVMSFDPERGTLKKSFINEFSHYSVKPDVLLINQEVFDYIVSAVKGKQAYTMGGTLMDFANEFDSGVTRKLNISLTECSDDVIDVYSHIAYVRFDFDYDEYYVEDLSSLPVPLYMNDSEFARLFRCSHLLSYDLFLQPSILHAFMLGGSIESILKIDILKHLAS